MRPITTLSDLRPAVRVRQASAYHAACARAARRDGDEREANDEHAHAELYAVASLVLAGRVSEDDASLSIADAMQLASTL